MGWWNARLRSFVIVCLASGCTGAIQRANEESPAPDPWSVEPEGAPEPPPTSHDAMEPLRGPVFQFSMTGPSPFPGVRFHTSRELAATIEAFSGVLPDLADLPEELERLNLRNDAQRTGLRDAQHLRMIFEVAHQVALTADVAVVVPCGADPCSDAEITTILEKAFMDRIGPADAAPYVALYQRGRAAVDHDLGRRALLQAVIFSPRFLYRTEIGDDAGMLTSFELAKKLSYFLWGAPPDEALFERAKRGELLDPDVYAAEVDRMLGDPRVASQIVHLIFDWLGLDELDLASKPSAAGLPEDLATSMRREVELLIEHVLVERREPLEALLLSSTTFVDDALAELYGLPVSPGLDPEEVSLEGTGRLGLLTTALVLAAHGKESGRSPMQRGHFLVDQLFCHRFPPEAGVATMQLPDGLGSLRERFEVLETVTPCRNCHRTLNAGFAFDVYDEIGRRYPADIVPDEDAHGIFDLAPNEPITFSNTQEAIRGLAEHPALSTCFVTQTYRFATGRVPGRADAATLAELGRAYTEDEQDVFDLLRSIALSEAFRRAAFGAASGPPGGN